MSSKFSFRQQLGQRLARLEEWWEKKRQRLSTPYYAGLLVLFSSWGLFFAWLWPQMFTRRGDGIWAGVARVWADWSAHLSYASVFAYRPPSLWFDAHPLYALRKFTYPFVADAVSGLLIKAGVDIVPAFVWPSILMTMLLLWLLYTFYFSVLKKPAPAFLATTLFLAGGGLGFLYWFKDLAHYERWPHPLLPPQEYTRVIDAKIEWLNVVNGQLMPQRAFLFAIPLTLIVLIWLWRCDQQGWQKVKSWQLVLAGVFSGLLPTVHVHSFMVLAIVGIIYALLRRQYWRYWLWWGLSSAVVAFPVYRWLYGGEIGLSFFAWKPGWLAVNPPNPVNPVWFWIVNWGVFLPLSWWAMWSRPRWRHPFFVAALVIFIAANLVLFQPYDWDNSKMLAWSYLFWAAPVVSLLSDWWRQSLWWGKFFLVVVYISLIFSGLLDIYRNTHNDQLSYRMWSNEELELAKELQKITTPTDRILVTDANNHWVSCLTGRQILLGYRGWMWTYGIDYTDVYQDMLTMFRGGRAAAMLLDEYQIKYVVIGPQERYSDDFKVNEAYFKSHYPVVLNKNQVQVYDVAGN